MMITSWFRSDRCLLARKGSSEGMRLGEVERRPVEAKKEKHFETRHVLQRGIEGMRLGEEERRPVMTK